MKSRVWTHLHDHLYEDAASSLDVASTWASAQGWPMGGPWGGLLYCTVCRALQCAVQRMMLVMRDRHRAAGERKI